MVDDFLDDDEYTSAPEPTKAVAVPDGDYVGELAALELKQFDDGGRRLEYTFVIQDGPQKGLRIWKNEYIPTKGSTDPRDVKKRGYLMMDAKAVSGNDAIRFSEFVGGLDGYTGQTFKITKKTNGKYTNVYINDRVAAPAPAPAPAPAAQPSLPGMPAPAATASPF